MLSPSSVGDRAALEGSRRGLARVRVLVEERDGLEALPSEVAVPVSTSSSTTAS